jgi:ABC-type transport system involved in multi-copper enzyme maturation permease subunit
MDAAEKKAPVEIKRWLPYWAVFQADVRLTLRSWVYRVWVFASLLTVGGYLLYRYAPYHEAGIIQTASAYVSDLLRWTVLVSAALVVVLTAGCISSERGTMADSVLSRGISRYQYFLGKWHARLAAVVGTYLAIGMVTLASSAFLLQEDLSWGGSLVALLTVAALLAAVISASVAASAVFNTTVMAIAVLWLVVYGGGFALSFLPGRFPAPDRTLQNLPNVLRGQYDLHALGQIMGYSLVASVASALLGIGFFARRDV